ncbi:MAG: Ig-like domain-containing protein [Abditibacteriota bacterium]|nr:Ig-like domain-containing protein [Abditibacteriota bacterium]
MLKKTKMLLVFILTILCLGTAIFAAEGKAVILTQYNGQAIEAYMLNDGTLTWYQDKDGYAIVKSGDVYYYAANNGYELVPTEYVVGEADPLFAGLIPNDIPKVKEEVEFKTVKDAIGNNGIITDSPLPIVFGNVHPLVIILDRYDTSTDEGLPLPASFYDDFDTYWAESSDYVKRNTVYYPDKYNPKAKDKDKNVILYHRTSIDDPVVIRHASFLYNWTETILQYVDQITSIDNYEEILDINNDGFIDKIIFIGPSGVPVENPQSYSTFSGVSIGNLKAGRYSVIPAYTWDEENNKLPYFGPIAGIGFSFIQPFNTFIRPVLICGNSGTKIEDFSPFVNGSFNNWFAIANQILSLQTAGAFGMRYPLGYSNEDMEELDVIGTIQFAFDGSLRYESPSSLDVNNDGFIDCIYVVYSSEDRGTVYNETDYSNYNYSITFSNGQVKNLGKVIVTTDSSAFNGYYVSDTLLSYFNYANYKRQSDEYRPVYQIDALGGSRNTGYDYLPISVYAKKRAGLLKSNGRVSVEDNEIGIAEINKDNVIKESTGEAVVWKLGDANSATGSRKTRIAYKIVSDANENEEFWVEYRKNVPSVQISGETYTFNQQGEGLYVYRINKTREGYGNYNAGQYADGTYIPDELFYFRTQGLSDYGILSGLYNLNGKAAEANVGVYKREEFSYDTAVNGFFSDGTDSIGFRIYDVVLSDDSATFKVKYVTNPPKVVSFTPNSAFIKVSPYDHTKANKLTDENDPANFQEYTAIYSSSNGGVEIWKSTVNWKFDEWDFLDLTFDNNLKTITLGNQSAEIGSNNEDGTDLILVDKYFRVNVTQSSYKYEDNKLYVYYDIAPTEYFLSKYCYNDIYFDGDSIDITMSAETYDGLKAKDRLLNEDVNVGFVRYSLIEPEVKVESITPINELKKDFYIEDIKVKSSYSGTPKGDKIEAGEMILHSGVIYQNAISNKNFVFDYVPDLVVNESKTFERNIMGTAIKATFTLNAKGFFGYYIYNGEVKDSCLALDYSVVVDDVSPASVLGIDLKEYIEKSWIPENRQSIINEFADYITSITPVNRVIDWTDWNGDGRLNLEPMTLADGLCTISSTSFDTFVSGDQREIDFGLEFDADKSKSAFSESKGNNIVFAVYGFASIKSDLEDVWEVIFGGVKPDAQIDYTYMGKYGIGSDIELSNPVVNGIDITPTPTDNPYISSKVLEFDKNIYYKVTYTPDKYKVSDITIKFTDQSSKVQLCMKYNPITRTFYAYNWTTDEWKAESFDVERNFEIGEFTIPCKAFTPAVKNDDGSYSFSFVARAKARFSDNPLEITAQVTDERGFESDVYKDPYTYIFRTSAANILPEVSSVTPKSGTIKAHQTTEFVVKVDDQDGIGDVYQINLILKYGGLDELYARYNYQTNRLSVLTEKGWSKEYALGSDNDLSSKNFKVDLSKSFVKTTSSTSAQLHLAVIPLSAFSGNSVAVCGLVTDISISNDATEYVVKKFGYIRISTSDPDAIMLNSSKVILDVNETYALKAVDGEGNEVNASWSSKDSDVATVNGNGVVTAVGYGSTKIIAKVDGETLTCSVKVKKPSIEYTGSDYTVEEKVVETTIEKREEEKRVEIKFDTLTTDSDSQTVAETTGEVSGSDKVKSCEKSQKEKISASEGQGTQGLVAGSSKERGGHAASNGSSSTRERSAMGTGVVSDVVKSASPQLDESMFADRLSEVFVTVEKGAKLTLVGLTPKGEEDKALVWSSSNERVVTVSEGIVKAKSIGSVVVKAKTTTGKVLTCKVKVIAPQTGKDVKLAEGKTFKFNYINAMNWKITDPTVVSINERGVVKALKAGITEVTCEANGKTIKSKVEVK